MSSKRLFLLVEGNDDERFFSKVIVPKFKGIYEWVEVWKYSQQGKKRVKNFLRSIEAMRADYIYFGDIDQSPCITAKKEKALEACRSLKSDKIIIVIKEIESWYLAGLDKRSTTQLGISFNFPATDDITKEKFNEIIPKKFTSRIDFMSEIVKHFSIDAAKQKSKSFKYFYEKHIQ